MKNMNTKVRNNISQEKLVEAGYYKTFTLENLVAVIKSPLGTLQSIPTNEYAVIDNSDNSLIRVCKSSYNLTQHAEIINGMIDVAEKSNINITDIVPFKGNHGVFTFFDTDITIPDELKKLIKSVEVFVIEGNSQDISLSSGICMTLVTDNKILYYNNFGRSGTRSSRAFSYRKSEIPNIITKGNKLAIEILKNLKDGLKIKVNDINEFIRENYRNNAGGKSVQHDTGRFESYLLDIQQTTHFFINKYDEINLAGLIIGFMDSIVIKNNYEDRNNFTYMYLPQSITYKKNHPIIERYLIKNKTMLG